MNNCSDDICSINKNLDIVLDKFLNILRRNKTVIISSLLFGILAHMYAFLNKLPNADELACMFTKGATIESGRWGLSLLSYIFPNYSMPWIYGVMSLCIITISICLMVHLFSIKNRVLQIVLSGLIITFPSLTGTFSYMFTSNSYAVSFLLSVMAALLLNKRSKYNHIMGSCLLVFSISIYQAYLSITSSLLLLILINDILNDKCTVKKGIMKGLRFLFALIISVAAYFLITLFVQKLLDAGFGAYASGAMISDHASLLMKIKEVYKVTLMLLLTGYHAIVPTMFSRVVHILCFTLAGIGLIVWSIHSKKKLSIIFVGFLALLLPISVNCMYLVGNSGAIHTLVLYSFVSFYVLMIIIVNTLATLKIKTKYNGLISYMVISCLLIVVGINCYIANEAYLKLQLKYNNCFAECNTIIAQIQMIPGYRQDTPIAFCGNYEEADFYQEEFENISALMGTNGTTPTTYSSRFMFEYYCGRKLNFVTNDEMIDKMQSSEFINMPIYPDNGSIRFIDDVLVVKFS